MGWGQASCPMGISLTRTSCDVLGVGSGVKLHVQWESVCQGRHAMSGGHGVGSSFLSNGNQFAKDVMRCPGGRKWGQASCPMGISLPRASCDVLRAGGGVKLHVLWESVCQGRHAMSSGQRTELSFMSMSGSPAPFASEACSRSYTYLCNGERITRRETIMIILPEVSFFQLACFFVFILAGKFNLNLGLFVSRRIIIMSDLTAVCVKQLSIHST